MLLKLAAFAAEAASGQTVANVRSVTSAARQQSLGSARDETWREEPDASEGLPVLRGELSWSGRRTSFTQDANGWMDEGLRACGRVAHLLATEVCGGNQWNI